METKRFVRSRGVGRVSRVPLSRGSMADFKALGYAPDNNVAVRALGRLRYLRSPMRVLKCSSTNRRIAEDRLPCWRVSSISATNSDSVARRVFAISFRVTPEGIFKADASLVSINDDGTFDD